MEIGEMTLNEIKEVAVVAGALGECKRGKTHSIPVGDNVFIRTVTMHYTGRVVSVTDNDMVLEDAAWIPDTGRFAAFLKDGTPNEVEPYPGMVIIQLGCVVDISPWLHDLPRMVK